MKKYTSYISIIFAAACWGCIGLFNRRLAGAGLGAMDIVVLRNFGAMAVLVIFFAVFDRRVFKIKPRHLPIFFGTGIISVLFFTWCYFSCQEQCSLAVAGILLYTSPVFVMIMAAIIWREKFTKRKVISLVLALLGCALVTGIFSGGFAITPKGFLFGLGAGFFYALYSIFARFALKHYGSFTVTVWTFIFCGLGSLFFLNVGTFSAAFASGTNILWAVGLVIVSTVLPYLLYTRGLAGVETGKAAIIACVEPVVAALVGTFVFGESMTVMTLCGIVCVLGGVVLLAKE